MKMGFAGTVKAALCVLTVVTTMAVGTVASIRPAFADPGLAYDGDHDVLVLPDCDIAVRYNNKTFVPVKAVTTMPAGIFYLKEKPLHAFKIYEDYSSAGMKSAPEEITIESYDVAKIGAFGTARFNKDFMGANRVREVQFTNERVGKEVGLSDTAFTGITAVKSFEIAGKNGQTPFYLHVFQTPKHLTIFARHMRGTSREFDLDPAVIVTQMRMIKTANSVGNIQLPDDQAVAADSAAPAKAQ